ncbi:hypothetical protein WSS_A38311, partial [Rhodococcus opacus M213]
GSVDEPVTVENVEDSAAFGVGELVLRVCVTAAAVGSGAAGRVLSRAAVDRTRPANMVADLVVTPKPVYS